jgi:hypothetical protein
MELKVKRKTLIEALHIYSAQQLQFAIRLGLLPQRSKPIPISSKKSVAELMLLERKFSRTK